MWKSLSEQEYKLLMDPTWKHVYMKSSNTPVMLLFLMPGKEQEDAAVTIRAEMTNQLQRRNISCTVNLRDTFLNTLCFYFFKRQEVNMRTRSMCESCWQFSGSQLWVWPPKLCSVTHFEVPTAFFRCCYLARSFEYNNHTQWGRKWSSGAKGRSHETSAGHAEQPLK